MSGIITNSGADYLLGLMSATEPVVPTYYVALIAGEEPSYTATGDDLDEPTATDYIRVSYENVSGNWNIVGGVMSNAIEIIWNVPGETWGDIAHWALCDSDFSGRALFVGSLVDVVPTTIGEAFYIPVGGLTVAIDNPEWQVYT